MSEGHGTTDRLNRLEENAAFTERRCDLLGEEIAELSKRLDLALRRVATLEERLERAASDQGEPPRTLEEERPPHSA